jgi:peptidoglycan/LPS O-acetylase OafA/YrhL
MATWGRVGWTGVDLFFVLSGYLIGGLLLDELRVSGRIQILRFYIRRAFKIWPAFYLVIIVTFVCFGPARQLLYESFFLQNYLGTAFGHGHFWSLAVEEHFYIGLPLLLAFCGESAIPMATAICSVVCLIGRTAAARATEPADFFLVAGTPTHLRIDSLMFGVLIAYICRYRPAIIGTIRTFRLFPVVSIGLLLPAILADQGTRLNMTIGFVMFYFAYGLLLIWFTGISPWRPLLRLAPIGQCSYSIYLCHFPLQLYVIQPLHIPQPWSFLCFVLASLTAGFFFSRVVEKPILALRERVSPPRQRASASGCCLRHEPV